MISRRKNMISLTILVLMLALPAAHAASAAPGDSEVRLVQTKEVTIGDPVNAFNTVAFDQYKLITHGEYQYTVFWDADYTLSLHDALPI